MSSNAWKAFSENRKDIARLLELHALEGGAARGRRWRLEVLNKSAIVLITAFWEAYCEDIAAEGLLHIVTHAPNAEALPVELRKQLAKELKAEVHELSIWKVAGDGWRTLLQARLDKMREDRNRGLNTPKSAEINDLFFKSLGIERISDCWRWLPTTTSEKARAKLDRFIVLRGSIAHRGRDLKTVKKAQVKDYFVFVRHLAWKTGICVRKFAEKATNKPPWKSGA